MNMMVMWSNSGERTMKANVTIKIFNADIHTEFDSEIDEEGNLHIWFDDEIIIPRGHYDYGMIVVNEV